MANAYDLARDREAYGSPTQPGRNPFSAAASAGQDPSGAPVGPSANGGGGGTRAYSALFDPSAGGGRGFLGALMGNPTRAEHQMEVAGGARQAAFAKIGEAIASGASAQKAVMDFVNTPEGMNLFVHDPDGIEQIGKAALQMAGKAKEDYTIGNTRMSGETNTPIYTAPPAPTAEMQNFEFFAKVGQMSPEAIAATAQAKLAGGGDPTQSEAAMKKLVDAGLIDEDWATKNLAGIIQTMPSKDQFNNQNGTIVIDMSDPQHPQSTFVPMNTTPAPVELAKPGEPAYAPGVSGGTDEKSVIGGAATGKAKPSASIIEGAGVVPAAAELLGGVLGQEMPGLNATDVAGKRNALRQIRQDTLYLKDSSKLTGKESEELKGMVDRMSVFSSPLDQGQAMLDYHDWLDRHEEQAILARDDPKGSPESRTEATKAIVGINNARANLPEVDDLVTTMERLKAEPGAVTKGLTAGVDAAKQVLGHVEDVAAPSGPGKGEPTRPSEAGPKVYKDKADLLAGLKSGKTQAGDTIIMGGKTYTLED